MILDAKNIYYIICLLMPLLNQRENTVAHAQCRLRFVELEQHDRMERETLGYCTIGNWTCFSFLNTFHLSSEKLHQFYLTGGELQAYELCV